MEFSLDVCLDSVGLLSDMIMHKTVCITGAPSFHASGSATQLIKQRNVPLFIKDAISLKSNATLEFPGRMSLG